jgi:hypothetical protein
MAMDAVPRWADSTPPPNGQRALFNRNKATQFTARDEAVDAAIRIATAALSN